MKTLTRLIRNLFTTTAAGRRAFPEPTLKAIQAAIADGETQHRAEVRLIVEPALAAGAVLNGHTSRQRARELFSLYRVWDTEENCGVLIYINLADHKVEIIADRGVDRAIGAPEWQAVCRTMTQGFARGAFHDSTIAGLVQLNQVLATHFPATGSRHNQLSDRPIML
jgi:uncharacterized membrane protein